MSRTKSRGVFSVSRWTSVSASVVEYLDYLLGTYREMNKVEFPAGAARALQALLMSALPAAKDERMMNPEASINDFLIVREVMRRSGAQSLEREDVRSVIEEYSSLFERLAQPHTMDDLSRELVVRVRIFFRNLQSQGENESYDHHMRRSHPYNHPNDQLDDE